MNGRMKEGERKEGELGRRKEGEVVWWMGACGVVGAGVGWQAGGQAGRGIH